MKSSRYDGKCVRSLLFTAVMTQKPPAPSDLADKFMLRLPDGMRDRLKAMATENGRSMNAEIVYRLQSAIDMYDYSPNENVHAESAHAALASGFDQLPPPFQTALLGFVKTLVEQERGQTKKTSSSAPSPKED